MRPSRGCAPSRFFEKGPSRTSASRDLFKRQIAGTVIRMGSSVARTLLSANPGSTHPQRSPQPRHPERSRAIREANGPTKSKDPYSLPISRERGPQLSLPEGCAPSRVFREGAITNLSIKGFGPSGRSPELSSEWFKCGADTPVREPRQHPPATIPKAPSS